MARLLDNAWSFWTSNTDIHRNSTSNTIIVPSLASQSSHGGFAVASTNQMHFGSGTPTGRYSVYCTSLSGDGDDNEEGSAALLISFGTTSNAVVTGGGIPSSPSTNATEEWTGPATTASNWDVT